MRLRPAALPLATPAQIEYTPSPRPPRRPQGAFAEAQAQYLRPDAAAVDRLASELRAKRIGVVAHFYMDPQVQGVLSAAAEQWPHVHISDSLVMADAAVKMAEAGCEVVAVLGVDFMSENVRAILDEAGHTGVKVRRGWRIRARARAEWPGDGCGRPTRWRAVSSPEAGCPCSTPKALSTPLFSRPPSPPAQVYRMSSSPIGCSLAEAAESAAYDAYLSEVGRSRRPPLFSLRWRFAFSAAAGCGCS